MVIENELREIEKEARELLESIPAFARIGESYGLGVALLARIQGLNEKLGVNNGNRK